MLENYEEPDEILEDAPEALKHARDLAHSLMGRVDRRLDIVGAGTADAIGDVRRGTSAEVMAEIRELVNDVNSALDALARPNC